MDLSRQPPLTPSASLPTTLPTRLPTTASLAAAVARSVLARTPTPPDIVVAPPPITGRRGRPSHLRTPLARIMKANGHTNIQLAQYLSCGKRSVEYWVTGEKVIPPRYLGKLGELYGVDAGYFTYDPDEVTMESYRIAEEFFTAETEF